MIEKFSVRGFKSLEDVDVDLGVVNVFIGANGSGKTNLLEALGMMSAAAAGRVDDEAISRRGGRLGRQDLMKSAFPSSQEDVITFKVTNEGGTYGCSLSSPSAGTSLNWVYRSETLVAGAIEIERKNLPSLNTTAGLVALRLVEMPASSFASKLLRAIQDYAIYSAHTEVLRESIPDAQIREGVGLSGGNLARGTVDMFLGAEWDPWVRSSIMAEIFEMLGWVKELKWGTDSSDNSRPLYPPYRLGFVDKYMAAERNYLSVRDVNEGVLHLLFVAVLATHTAVPPLFSIDNFDQALNPRLARHLAESFCRWILNSPRPRQVLLTTHNPLVLDGLPLLDDRVRLFAVERTNKGKTVVRRIAIDEKILNDAKTTALSTQWVMGNLGAVPNV